MIIGNESLLCNYSSRSPSSSFRILHLLFSYIGVPNPDSCPNYYPFFDSRKTLSLILESQKRKDIVEISHKIARFSDSRQQNPRISDSRMKYPRDPEKWKKNGLPERFSFPERKSFLDSRIKNGNSRNPGMSSIPSPHSTILTFLGT